MATEVMPRAPRLRPVGAMPEELAAEVIGETVEREVGVGVLVAQDDSAPADWADETVLVHECFLEEMAAAHAVFLRRFGAGAPGVDETVFEPEAAIAAPVPELKPEPPVQAPTPPVPPRP
ncbi:MAG: hypothetical protein NTV51_03095, partial [Verrucomicrobia bacterium]|nr:hypothetical protein [Verrucomicrobiota bacterium]